MPRFTFDLQQNDERSKLESAEFADREAARQRAIELAGAIMDGEGEAGRPASSCIIISDEDGDDLDTIISRQENKEG